MIGIQEILPIKLYRFHYEGDLDSVIDYVFELTHQQHEEWGLLNVKAPNPLSVMNILTPDFMKRFPEVFKFMLDSVNEVTEYEKWQHPEMFMSQIWTNLQRHPDQGHTRHTHPNAVWSSLFNVYAHEPNHVTIFHSGTPSGDEDAAYSQHHYTNKRFHPEAARMLQQSPEGPTDRVNFEGVTHKPGDFIVFRSFIPHSVPPFQPQNVQDMRITMSANFWPYQSGRSDRATWLRVIPDYETIPPSGMDRGTGWEDDKRIERERQELMEREGRETGTQGNTNPSE